MSKSNRRKQREMLSKGGPMTAREHDLMLIVADLIEATPQGQRNARMSALLADVQAAEAAHPEGE